MDSNTGYYSRCPYWAMINPGPPTNPMKDRGYTFFLLALLIGLVISIFTPDTVTADTRKEKQTQTRASEPTKSGSKPGSGSESPKQQIIAEPKKYRGEPGSFVFHEADLKNVLIFFAKIYKLNIVIDPGISGKVTVRLSNVPWDQALDLILRQHGLALVIEGRSLIPRKMENK